MPTVDSSPASLVPSHPLAVTFRRRGRWLSYLWGSLAGAGLVVAICSKPLAVHLQNPVFVFLYPSCVSTFIFGFLWLYALGHYGGLATAVNRLARNPEALARWTYTADEQSIFIARERLRLRWFRKFYASMLLLAIAGAAVLWVRGALVGHRGWQLHDLGFDVSTGLALAVALDLGFMIFVALEAAALPARFAGEVVVGNEGVLTFNEYTQWSGYDKKLVGVEFLDGEPGEIRFAIRTTSASKTGTDTYVDHVCIPVPRDHEDEARKVVASLLGGVK